MSATSLPNLSTDSAARVSIANLCPNDDERGDQREASPLKSCSEVLPLSERCSPIASASSNSHTKKENLINRGELSSTPSQDSNPKKRKIERAGVLANDPAFQIFLSKFRGPGPDKLN